jgi:single-strand DNA-binding protein
MANETQITVIGRLTADPDLRFTQNGLAVANFTVASNPRTFDRQTNEWKDEEPTFWKVNAWRELGEHSAASLRKGMEVIVVGNVRTRPFQDREGQQRTSLELEATAVGPNLRGQNATVERAQTNQNQQQNRQQYQQQGQPPAPQPPQGQPVQQAGQQQPYQQGGQQQTWAPDPNQGQQQGGNIYQDESPF